MSPSLEQLALRCEAAADRELDALIHESVTTFAPRLGGPGWAPGTLVVPVFPGFAVLPAYTTSLDASMKLIPDNWRVASMGETVIEGNDPWNVLLIEKRFDGRAKSAEGDAATPALAMAAAALRAISATRGSNNG